MIKKIDTTSEEYIYQLEKTQKFTDKVIKQFNFVYNPNEEINESVQMGLTRNKMIYGKYFCPCFMVIGETKEERKKADNRICPCKPALNDEIPNNGVCHCGIFCTPEYAKAQKMQKEIDEVAHEHSRGLTKEECEFLLAKEQLSGEELEALLEARELKFIDFNLVDVREWMEWVGRRIKGTDYLVPTTSFYSAIEPLKKEMDKPTILYCLSGSRSAYVQMIMKQMGFKQVSNLTYGIYDFNGEYEKGE